jgi:regulator of protease activity HflC (stomatin/prohibitin superfamily)
MGLFWGRKKSGDQGKGKELATVPKDERDRQFFAMFDRITADTSLTDRQRSQQLEAISKAFLGGAPAEVKEGGIFGTHSVKPGHVAVVTDRGRIRQDAHGPGTLFGVPGATKLHEFETRLKTYDLNLEVITRRKLPFKISITILHQIQEEAVLQMFTAVGQEYETRVIRPLATQVARALAYTKTEEHMMDPAFAEELGAAIDRELENAGLMIKVTINSVTPAGVITRAYEQMAEAEYSAMVASAKITAFELQMKYTLMQFALKLKMNVAQAQVDAVVQSIMGQVQIDLEKQRRQPDFLTESYFRAKIIEAGWGAMGVDALGDVAQSLADIFADFVRGK